jgi:hypothetical protein
MEHPWRPHLPTWPKSGRTSPPCRSSCRSRAELCRHAGRRPPRARPDIGTGQYIEYDGQPFYLKHTPDAFDLADLAEYMEGAADQPIRALGGINARLRLWFVDYEALRTAFREKNAGIDLERQMGEYGELASRLFETLAARPTEAPADTSTGRTPTSTSSKDGSPSADGSPSTDPSPSETSTPG